MKEGHGAGERQGSESGLGNADIDVSLSDGLLWFNILGAQDEMDAADFLTADFQRVNITGEDSSGVPVEDLHSAAELLTKALNIRQKYCRLSYQEFPANVER